MERITAVRVSSISRFSAAVAEPMNITSKLWPRRRKSNGEPNAVSNAKNGARHGPGDWLFYIRTSLFADKVALSRSQHLAIETDRTSS